MDINSIFNKLGYDLKNDEVINHLGENVDSLFFSNDSGCFHVRISGREICIRCVIYYKDCKFTSAVTIDPYLFSQIGVNANIEFEKTLLMLIEECNNYITTELKKEIDKSQEDFIDALLLRDLTIKQISL